MSCLPKYSSSVYINHGDLGDGLYQHIPTMLMVQLLNTGLIVNKQRLVGGLEDFGRLFFFFYKFTIFYIYREYFSSQMTNSYIFQMGGSTTPSTTTWGRTGHETKSADQAAPGAQGR